MGVDYRNYLVPQDLAFVPEVARICELVERLRAERWVLTPSDPTFDDVWADPPAHFRTGGYATPFVDGVTGGWKARWAQAVPVPIPLTESWLRTRRSETAVSPQSDELSLHFEVSSGDETFEDRAMPYPLAYGADECGYHDIFVLASRDFAWDDVGEESVDCVCGASLSYTISRKDLVPVNSRRRIRSVCPTCGRPFAEACSSLDRWRNYDSEQPIFRFALLVDCSKGWPEARRVGEPEGIRRAMEELGYNFASWPGAVARKRAAEDTPGAPEFDASVLRSVYGDPAPPISPRLFELVEETIGCRLVSIPQFY